MEILIETSARHAHLSQKDLDILFGKGYNLTKRKDLSQPGQYVCEERITIKGPKKSLENVSIIGPVREHTQVELSATDARSIGINAPIRESGDLDEAADCEVVGPKTSIESQNCVIVPKRHIHITPKDAQEFQLQDGQIVSVKVGTEERALIFGDVVVRVNEKFSPAMHIDTDESNSAGVTPSTFGEIIKL